jgi:hypothetical protein
MYSGKIAVPPGGGGIRKYISYRKHPITGNNVLRAWYIQQDYKLISHNNNLNSLKTTVGKILKQKTISLMENKNIELYLPGCNDTLVICNSTFMALVI